MRSRPAALALAVLLGSLPVCRVSLLADSAASDTTLPQSSDATSRAAQLLLRGVDTDLRLLGKADLTSDERRQREHAKSLAQNARSLLQRAGGQETEALAIATAASKEVAVLVRRQLRLDQLMAAAGQYRTGETRAAVQSLADSLASDLGAPVRYIEANRERWGVEGTALVDVGDTSLAALCLVETEVAFLDGYDAQSRLAFAWRLLTAATPGNLPPRFLERWSIAVTGHLQGYFLLADAMLQAQDAVRRFPNDADILLLAGSVYEFIASPGVDIGSDARPRLRGDAFVRTYVTKDTVPDAPRPDDEHERLAEAKRTGLLRAEEYYRKALIADANNREAHLRLGRVLFLTSRLDAALPELRHAAASSDRRLHYLASMFEGALYEATDQPEAAVAAYEDAVRVCPQCLSGGVALSEAQRVKGEAEMAAATLDAALTRDAKGPYPDFWWDYLVGAYWQRDTLMRELRGGLR
jgi:tetratricopeptide (TPR) repeat protein